MWGGGGGVGVNDVHVAFPKSERKCIRCKVTGCVQLSLSACMSVSTKNISSPDPGCSISAKYLQTEILSVLLFARYT